MTKKQIPDLWLMLIGIPVLAYLIPVLFYGLSLEEGLHCFSSGMFPALLNTGIYWIGDRYIMVVLKKKYPLHIQNKKRITSTIVLVLIYTTVVTAIFEILKKSIPLSEYPAFLNKPFYFSLGTSLFATVTILAIYEALYYLNQWKEALTMTERLKKENTVSQLEALRNQVNPHFLFNSLNTLASLIPEDQEKAVGFVHHLSNVYRNILELKEKQVVTLEEELECLQHYIFLINARFAENCRFQIAVSNSAKSRYTVPLAIQILVENAIKHNITSHRKPLQIEIYSVNDNYIVVKNNLQLKLQDQEGTGTGLENINNRYRLTFQKNIEVEQGEDYFIVTLPLILIGKA